VLLTIFIAPPEFLEVFSWHHFFVKPAATILATVQAHQGKAASERRHNEKRDHDDYEADGFHV
jgi:hypothetical protein